jgi:hypothetical protein
MSEPRKTWKVRLKLDDMRSQGEPFVHHADLKLEVPGKDARQAAELLRRALQRAIDIEAATTDLWG